MDTRRNAQEIDRHWKLVMTLPHQPPGLCLFGALAQLAEAGHDIDHKMLKQDLISIGATIPLAGKTNEMGTRVWINFPLQSDRSDARSSVASSSGNMTFANAKC
jgi:hypothetical protein